MSSKKAFFSAQNVFVELNFPNKKAPEDFSEWLKDLGTLGLYTGILHDKDVLDDKKTPKTIHAHVALETQKKMGMANWIETLANLLKLPKNCVSVESMTNPIGAKRYLWHLDNPEKFQYRDDPATNDPKAFKRACAIQPMAEVTISDIDESNNMHEFIERVGIQSANKYRSLFNQCKDEEKAPLQIALAELQEKHERLSKSVIRSYHTLRGLYNAMLEDDPYKEQVKEVLLSLEFDLFGGRKIEDD